MRAVFWFGLVCVAGCGGRATTETGEGDSDTGVTAPVTGVLDPSNVDASLFELAEGPPLVADGVGSIQIDTSNCVFSDAAALVVESGGVELCVVVVPGLTVPAFSRLDLRGSRPLVILSTGDIHVEEYADISGSGRGQAGGAGAGDAFAGANAGATGLGGGGGGGGCGAGGAGGAAEGGAGGAAHAPIDMLEPLQAGSRGGAGPAGVGGGGGGGALQLSSRTSVRIDGGLYFEGAGGTAGATGGGGGGGSGGSVLLEAPVVAFGENGIIAVTGGGGGGAGTGAEDGAVPEGGAGTDGGDGGDGGLATLAGGAGAAGASGGGGGGGGAGCVVVRSSTGATFPALLEAMNGLGAGALHVGQIRVLP